MAAGHPLAVAVIFLGMKPSAIIVDLDSTFFDPTHRLHLIQTKPKRWDEFFALAHLDAPNKWCLEIVKSMQERHEILFVTGRRDSDRASTEQSLRKHLNMHDIPSRLWMRKVNDRRDPALVKKEIYEAHIVPHYNVLFALDDSGGIIRLWRSLGIPALQCDDWEERDAAAAAEIALHFAKEHSQS